MSTAPSRPDPLAERHALRRGLFGFLLVASVLPKLGLLLFRGELWADEISFAMNIGPRGFFEMGRPFLHLQVAPFGAMAAIKLSVSVFGESAVTYRLMPFFAAIAVVALVYPIGKRLAGPTAGLLAMAVTGLTADLTYYATETKPYSLDAALGALLCLLTLRVFDAPDDRRAKTALIVCGVLVGWFSLPSLFVLGGCGLGWALFTWLRQRDLKALLPLIGVGALWLGSFGAHYQLFIAKSSTATNKNVAKFWSQGFAPFPPTNLAELKWYPAKFFYFFDSPGALSIRYLAGVIFVVGLVWLIRRRKGPHAIVLVVPFALAILASAMSKYSSVGRLMLFALPGMMVVLAVGLLALGERSKVAQMPLAVVLGLVLIGPRLADTYDKVLHPEAPKEIQHLMPGLAKQWQTGDEIYLAGPGLATLWEHHSKRLGLPNDYFGVADVRDLDENGHHPALRNLAKRTFGMKRLWMIAESARYPGDPKKLGRTTEPYSSFVTRFFDRWGGKGKVVDEADALTLYFYDLSEAKLPGGPEAIVNDEPK